MKISDELIGKDVIDESGDHIGIVNDVDWDFDMNKVISIPYERGRNIRKNRPR